MSFGCEIPGLKTPASFIVGAGSGECYISNINGSQFNRDNNGFITKLRREGALVARGFIEGDHGVELNVPKGLAIIEEILYATDIGRVCGLNKET